MQSQLVFQEKKERERLRRQNLLLSQAEKPALEHFFKGNQNFLFWILAAMMEPEPFTAFQMTGFPG